MHPDVGYPDPMETEDEHTEEFESTGEPDESIETTEDKTRILYDLMEGEQKDPTCDLINGENLNENIDLEAIADQVIGNVFENGLDLDFILTSTCPICGFRKKDAMEMTVMKKGYIHRLMRGETPTNPVVGVTTMCQNCGHVDIFGYDIHNILYYLQGRGDKCHVSKRPYNREDTDT